MLEKPKYLYHISSRIPDGEDYILPNINVDITKRNKDYYVFASHEYDYLACFNNKYSLYRVGHLYKDIPILLIFTENIDDLRKYMLQDNNSLYKVESSFFTNVLDRNGINTKEWVSKEKVKIIDKINIPYHEILENNQVFYYQIEQKSSTKYYNSIILDALVKYKDIKVVLQELVKSREITYENQALGINRDWLSNIKKR